MFHHVCGSILFASVHRFFLSIFLSVCVNHLSTIPCFPACLSPSSDDNAEEEEEEEEGKQPKIPERMFMEAIHEYEAQNQQELSIQNGEKLKVSKHRNSRELSALCNLFLRSFTLMLGLYSNPELLSCSCTLSNSL